MNIGKSLQIALKQKELRNIDLAASMETSEQQISIWANKGNITKKNLIRICGILEMKVSEFIALGE